MVVPSRRPGSSRRAAARGPAAAPSPAGRARHTASDGVARTRGPCASQGLARTPGDPLRSPAAAAAAAAPGSRGPARAGAMAAGGRRGPWVPPPAARTGPLPPPPRVAGGARRASGARTRHPNICILERTYYKHFIKSHMIVLSQSRTSRLSEYVSQGASCTKASSGLGPECRSSLISLFCKLSSCRVLKTASVNGFALTAAHAGGGRDGRRARAAWGRRRPRSCARPPTAAAVPARTPTAAAPPARAGHALLFIDIYLIFNAKCILLSLLMYT